MEEEISETRIRILEAAAAIFAKHGFAATTIRHICSKAQVNLAAVNYHFGSKEGLYRETIRYARERAYESYPTTYGLDCERITGTATAVLCPLISAPHLLRQ